MTEPSAPSRVDVDLIRAPEGLEAPDDLAQVEKADLKAEEWRHEVEQREERARVEGVESDIKNRGKYTGRLYFLMLGWMVAVYLVIVASGITPLPFKLSDAVLIALITGTTANVIGLFVIVARYLFAKK